MKFGVREICDVVLKAKAAQKIGSKVFYKNEPVIYFDSLKTSSLEGQSTTVYAQGGRGNSRLIGWDGERTVTFTMEDALISPMGISILTGAGLIDASENNSIKMHTTERTDRVNLVWADGVACAIRVANVTDSSFDGELTLMSIWDNERHEKQDKVHCLAVCFHGGAACGAVGRHVDDAGV